MSKIQVRNGEIALEFARGDQHAFGVLQTVSFWRGLAEFVAFERRFGAAGSGGLSSGSVLSGFGSVVQSGLLGVSEVCREESTAVSSLFSSGLAGGRSVGIRSGGCESELLDREAGVESGVGCESGLSVDAEGDRNRCQADRGGECESQRVWKSGVSRGKHYKRNLRRREERKRLRMQGDWRSAGACETVVTQASCPSYQQALSDAEREAKESLARRRSAENAVAEKLAKLKLESLEDEQKCQEYADLKRQRVIQWTNEATAKSQQSLEKQKSIDPGSSSSQYEIRQQAKKLADVEAKCSEVVANYECLVASLYRSVPDAAEIIASSRVPSSVTMDMLQAGGECYNSDCSVTS